MALSLEQRWRLPAPEFERVAGSAVVAGLAPSVVVLTPLQRQLVEVAAGALLAVDLMAALALAIVAVVAGALAASEALAAELPAAPAAAARTNNNAVSAPIVRYESGQAYYTSFSKPESSATTLVDERALPCISRIVCTKTLSPAMTRAPLIKSSLEISFLCETGVRDACC